MAFLYLYFILILYNSRFLFVAFANCISKYKQTNKQTKQKQKDRVIKR